MTNPQHCDLLNIPISSPYLSFGLHLSLQAFQGPTQNSYPHGISLTHTTHEDSIHAGEGSTSDFFVHTLCLQGHWPKLHARFTKETLIHRAHKLFGRQEPQGGDPLFDDRVFVYTNEHNTALTHFISNDHVQSALLALVLHDGYFTSPCNVDITANTIRYTYTSDEEGLHEYNDIVLPLLALATWAQRLATS